MDKLSEFREVERFYIHDGKTDWRGEVVESPDFDRLFAFAGEQQKELDKCDDCGYTMSAELEFSRQRISELEAKLSAMEEERDKLQILQNENYMKAAQFAARCEAMEEVLEAGRKIAEAQIELAGHVGETGEKIFECYMCSIPERESLGVNHLLDCPVGLILGRRDA